ncbi:MAG: M20/M25/M40 family metallo-hydrolase, partial [Methylococcales bacterium]|nr:M20/M25/M40 family metallo-hydrolase [Methylococcales bacterium]
MLTIPDLTKDSRVVPALQHFHTHIEPLIAAIIAVQQIPAPTFDEGLRADYVEQQFLQYQLNDVLIDPLNNVYARLAGHAPHKKPIIITAHSDTVFPHGTDLTVTRNGQLVHGPGIADNSAGVGGLLWLAKTMVEFKLIPERDIWFVVNVGEEGNGDLKGMRALTERFHEAAGFIVLEGGMYGHILHEAIGVRRFRVDVKADGGHSWSDFGRTSAIHVLGDIITKIDGLRVLKSPKTTYNIGVIKGGTSINTIAANAHFLLDLRSESPQSLQHLITQFKTIIRRSQRRFERVTISYKPIGNRPAGKIPRNSWL